MYAVESYAPNASLLAKTVREIITNVSKYYNIYGEEEEKILKSQILIDNYLNKDIKEITEYLNNVNVNVIKIGNGNTIIKQYPDTNTKIIKGDKVFLQTNGEEIIMPNIVGYSKNELSILCKLMNLKVKYDGNGYRCDKYAAGQRGKTL